MPQVSAAALQPSVPIQKDPGGAYQTIPGATPEAFGAGIGQAQQGLGQAGEHFGNVLMENALQRQNFANQVATDKARNDFQDFTIAQSYGNDQTPGYHATRGADAVTQFPDYRDALQNERARIRDTLSNDKQKLDFDNETRRLMAGHLEAAGRHRDQQMKVDAVATNKATDNLAQTSITQAALNDDDAAFNKAVEDKINAKVKSVQASGGGNDPQQIYAAMSQAREEAVLGWAEAKGTQNPSRALQVLEANQSIIDPLKYANLHNHLTQQAKSHAGKDVGDALYEDRPLPGAAAALGRQTGPGGLTAAQHYNYLKSIGATPNEAALLTSAAGAESGFDPTKTHDAELLAKQGKPPGYGLYGHNADRLLSMQGATGSQTPSWQDQAKYALRELRERPEGAQVNAAKTPEELTDLQLKFEQPGVPNREARLASTREYMQRPPGETATPGATAAASGGAGIIDKTADAGFGNKFGPLTQPQGMVVHHTAGGESVDDVIKTFKKTGFPSQFIIDRQGKIYQTLPDGYQGRHIRNSYGPLGEGKTNQNMEGVEIIANDDGDVLPVQQQAAARLIAMRAQKWGYDPKTSVFGHGELNPGHKQADEGMSTVTRIRNGSLPTQVAATPAPETTGAGQPPTETAAAPAATGQPTAAAVVEPAATSGGSTEPTAPPAAGAGGGGLAPMVDVEGKLQRVDDLVANGTIEPDVGERARARIRQRFNQDQAREANDRAAVHRKIENDLTAMMDGKEISGTSEDEIRHYFPKQQADELIQKQEDAREGGRLIASMRTSSPEQIAQQRAELQKGVDEPGAPDYAKRRKMLTLFDTAAKQQQTALWGHTESDPVAYLANFNLPFQHARNVATAKGATPQDHETYATLAASEQTRMGVPVDEQHLLTVPDAQAWSKAIGSNPEQAPRAMQALAKQWGQAWPQVWADLITLGKLPAAYQVVGQLSDYDSGNAAILSRTLGAQVKDDSPFEKSIGRKVSGGKSIKQIVSDAVEGSDAVQAYEHSLRRQSASDEQVVAIRQAIEHLAAGRAIYLSEDPTEATNKAIDAVVGKFRFMPNGGARVPATRYDDVSANAQDTINGLSVANTLVPDVHWMGPTATPPQDYINELKARHVWATGGKSDRAVLYDHGGRLVRDRNGKQIEVLFSDGPKVPLPAAPPLPGTYDPRAPTP